MPGPSGAICPGSDATFGTASFAWLWPRHRGHPRESVDPAGKRGELVLDHLFGPRLLRGREIARHVQPADRLAESLVRGGHGPLPAVTELRRALERFPIEGEPFLDERYGQKRGEVVDKPEDQIVLPCREGHLARQRGDAGDGARLPDHEGVLRLEPRAREEGRPVETGRAAAEVLPRPVIVSFLHVLRGFAARVRFRDAALELEDPGGFRVGVGDAGEFQHRGDVLLVCRSDARHALRRVEVVLAVGHAEAALQQERRIAARVVQVLGHPEAEQVVRVEIGRVQHVHVCAQRAADQARETRRVGDRRDAVERGLERLEPLRLDSRLVHEARVVVADLPGVGSCGSPRSGQLGDQVGRPLVRQLLERGARPVAAPVGRDLRVFDPGPVRVAEEVVSRRDRGVDAREVDAGGGRRGRG